MRKIYIFIGISVIIAFGLAMITKHLSAIAFVVIPTAMFFWARRSEADVFMETLDANERIIFYSLGTRELIPFVAEKIHPRYARIGDKLIQLVQDTAYVYHGKVVMFCQQKQGLEDEEIWRLKNEIQEHLFTPKVFFRKSFWKTVGVPFLGAGMIEIANFVPYVGLIVYVFGYLTGIFGPFISLYFMWSDGALEFAESQGRREVTIFYISGARTIEFLKSELKAEGYAQLPGFGVTRLADDTDYFLNGLRTFFTARGVHHTFSLEIAQKAVWFSEWGFRDLREVIEAQEIVDDQYDEYDTLEEALNKGDGEKIVEQAQNNIEQKRQQEEVSPLVPKL